MGFSSSLVVHPIWKVYFWGPNLGYRTIEEVPNGSVGKKGEATVVALLKKPVFCAHGTPNFFGIIAALIGKPPKSQEAVVVVVLLTNRYY